MARYGDDAGLAAWLEHQGNATEPGATLVIAKFRTISAAPDAVFTALTSSDEIVRFFPYEAVESTWGVGAEIRLHGGADGTPFTDFGTIEVLERPTAFQYRYWSDNHGTERTPVNHLRIRYDLSAEGAATKLAVTHFDIRDGGYRAMMAGAWDMLLEGLAAYAEGQA